MLPINLRTVKVNEIRKTKNDRAGQIFMCRSEWEKHLAQRWAPVLISVCFHSRVGQNYYTTFVFWGDGPEEVTTTTHPTWCSTEASITLINFHNFVSDQPCRMLHWTFMHRPWFTYVPSYPITQSFDKDIRFCSGCWHFISIHRMVLLLSKNFCCNTL